MMMSKIEEEAELLHVIKIVAQLRAGIVQGRAIGIVDLRPAGQAGPDRMAFAIERQLLRQLLDEFRPLRPWPHQRHVAFQHVDQLRQLVNSRAAEKPADGGDPVVAGGGPDRARRFRIDAHGTQFQDLENAPAQGHALLAIENRSAIPQPYRRHRRQQDNQRTGKDQQAHNDIENALHPPAERTDGKAFRIKHPVHVQALDVDAARFLFQKAHILEHRIAGGPAGDQRFQRHAAAFVGRDDDLLGEYAIGDIQQIARRGDDVIGRIRRQPRIDGPERIFMNEGHVILQMPPLASQNPDQVPGTLSRADHQKAGTKQGIAPQQPEHQSRQHCRNGETDDRRYDERRR